MKGRNVFFTLFVVLGILGYAVYQRRQEPQRKEAFDRQPNRTEYTAYTLCRMKCLQVDKDMIGEVTRKGIIIFNKSDRRRWPCPALAVQGRTSGGRYLRVLFEQCKERTTVIRVDDLEKEVSCNCRDKR